MKSAPRKSDKSVPIKQDRPARIEALRQFDLDLKYGPCLGILRIERWNRAVRLGLEPPKTIQKLLIDSVDIENRNTDIWTEQRNKGLV